MFLHRMLLPLLFPIMYATLLGCHKNTFFHLAAPPAPTNLAKQHPGYTLDDYNGDKDKYKEAMNKDQPSDIDLKKARRLRDNIANGLIKDVELLHSAYETGLLSGRGEGAIIEDAITLGLSAGSTISNVKATKTILSALVTAFTGINLSYEKNLYGQQSFPVIALAIRTRMGKLKTDIIVQLRDKDVNQYPESQAEADVFSYAHAGTLAQGLIELQQEAGNALKDQKADTDRKLHTN